MLVNGKTVILMEKEKQLGGINQNFLTDIMTVSGRMD